LHTVPNMASSLMQSNGFAPLGLDQILYYVYVLALPIRATTHMLASSLPSARTRSISCIRSTYHHTKIYSQKISQPREVCTPAPLHHFSAQYDTLAMCDAWRCSDVVDAHEMEMSNHGVIALCSQHADLVSVPGFFASIGFFITHNTFYVVLRGVLIFIFKSIS
jgi:hypothetical protein